MSSNYEGAIPKETRKKSFLQSFDRQKLDSADMADFSSKLLSFVRQNKVAADALVAGNIQMLGLEALKERFGANWDGIKDKVHLLVESTIKRHITAVDVYCLINDEQFIVLFGKADKAEANVTAGKIGAEVNAKLSGAGAGMDAVTVRPLVLEVPRDDPAALQTPARLEETVEEARRRREAEEQHKLDAAQHKLKMRFWPVANVRKRLVSCYQAELHLAESDADGFDPNEKSETGSVEAAIDRLTLQRGGAALVDAASHKWRALLIVPVHFETLAAKNFRTEYIEVCKLLPRIAEKRMLLMVKGLEDGVPQQRLHTLFSYVAPYVAGFVGNFSFEFRRSSKLGGVKMLAVGVDGAEIGQPTAADIKAMKGFIAGNREPKMRRYFFGAACFEVATAARRAQFDYVQGLGVAPSMPISGKVFNI